MATASLPTELDEYKPEEEVCRGRNGRRDVLMEVHSRFFILPPNQIELISEVERKAFEQAVASTLSGKATGDAGAAGRGEDKPASE